MQSILEGSSLTFLDIAFDLGSRSLAAVRDKRHLYIFRPLGNRDRPASIVTDLLEIVTDLPEIETALPQSCPPCLKS